MYASREDWIEGVIAYVQKIAAEAGADPWPEENAWAYGDTLFDIMVENSPDGREDDPDTWADPEDVVEEDRQYWDA